ncbi:unnamed protein product [Chrysodeixis includens]|uniref:Uncharacterized protein n=1 Tax=Chrysodeixis includens TaxID=689277 RepID=A0A9N8L121_CHRIL|nr:unnamed protein product [Chrysodeixis includens]
MEDKLVLPEKNMLDSLEEINRGDLPNVLRSRRNILEPIKMDQNVPTWSLAKGPCIVGMQKKKGVEEDPPELNSLIINGKKVPPVRNGLQSSSGEISTIMEGRVQSYPNAVSKATIDLFSAGGNSHKGLIINGKKVPPVRNGLQSSSGEISTIMEGRVQSYPNAVSKATIDLFSAGGNSHKGLIINGKKVPPVRNGLQSSSGEISTIMEGRVQSYPNAVSKATIDLFSAGGNSHKG